MQNPSNDSHCPGCQQPLAPGRAQGLCPRCLLVRAAFATEADVAVAAAPLPDPAVVAAAFPQLDCLEVIGRGGMGVVYKARQRSLNRWVALKLLAPERVLDPRFAERFRKEAQALALLNHPSIVTIHDFGVAGEGTAPVPLYYLLMEYVDGVNLRQAMKAGRFTPEQALAIVPPVCLALQYAHERGIVHRDIKPENLLLDRDGHIKIADFGIARMLGADPGAGASPEGRSITDPTAVPATGTILSAAGTPQYMAPEQAEAGRADHRADIYSLGVVLYELLTGELPGARLAPPSSKVEIDVRLDAVVLRALSVQPEMRYATALEFRTQVNEVAKGPPASRGLPQDSRTPNVPRLIRSSGGFLYRPEEVYTLEGMFLPWRHRGQWVLDEQALTHFRSAGRTVIPLAEIQEISIGTLPRTLNPAGLDVLHVVYREAGQDHRVLVLPADGWFSWPSVWNARVGDWARTLRQAVVEWTGRQPGHTPRDRMPEEAAPFWTAWVLPAAMAIPGLVTFLILMLMQHRPYGGNTGLFLLFVFAIPLGAVAGLALVFLALRNVMKTGGASLARRMSALLVLVAFAVVGSVLWIKWGEQAMPPRVAPLPVPALEGRAAERQVPSP